MPRWASRLTLEVSNVCIEPLPAITADDALAEGIAALTKDGKLVRYGLPDRDGLPGNDDHGWHWQQWQLTPQHAFERLWVSLHEQQSWEQSPAVVALTFRVVCQNVDSYLAESAVA